MRFSIHTLPIWLTLGVGLAISGCSSLGVTPQTVIVKLIALNDFHGNIEVPAENNGGSVVLKDTANAAGTTVRTGGAAYLATLIRQLKSDNPNNIFVGAGDMVGATPVTSTLTHDEATIDVLNQIGLEVTSVGNHEFDHGKAELLRQQKGGCYPGGVIGTDTCIKEGRFSGAQYQYLSANVVDLESGTTLFPATYVKHFGSVSVGFIGLTLKGTPEVVTSTGVAGLNFLDEASTINHYATQLKASGVDAVVVLMHQGGQSTASTLNDPSCPNLSGDILPIVDNLSKAVDVVLSGHTHQEYICQRNGKLLTSAGYDGSTVTNIDLSITPNVGVTQMAARSVPVINDLNKTVPSGYAILAKDSAIDSTIQSYANLVASLKNRTVGTIAADLKRALLANSSTPTRDETAEGAMGDVMADVYLTGGPKADIAFINPGAVRADLIYKNPGAVTYGDLLTVAPFSNTLATVDLTGAQILRLLEQQWEAPNCSAKTGANGCGRLLQPSANFSYTWNAAKPVGAAEGFGARVEHDSLRLNGAPIEMTKSYRVTLNQFMAPGPGDNFSVVTTSGKNITPSGIIDIDAFVSYMKSHPNLSPPEPRIKRLN